MITAFQFCILLLVCGLPLWFLYWHLFRPVLLTRLRYVVYKSRDDLRMLLLDGEIREKDRVAYSLIERFCNRSVHNLDQLDLADLVFTKMNQSTRLEAIRDLEIIGQSAPELRAICSRVMSTVVGATLANSPGAIVLLTPFAIFTVTIFWFSRVKQASERLYQRVFGMMLLRPA